MSKKKTKPIKINDTWSIERHVHGGFNLIESNHGFNKDNKPTLSTRSHYYPKLSMCADKMVECGFDNEADSIMRAVDSMRDFTILITEQLERLIK